MHIRFWLRKVSWVTLFATTKVLSVLKKSPSQSLRIKNFLQLLAVNYFPIKCHHIDNLQGTKYACTSGKYTLGHLKLILCLVSTHSSFFHSTSTPFSACKPFLVNEYLLRESVTSFCRNLEFTSYEVELCKMTPHFESLIQNFLHKFFLRVANSTSKNIRFLFELRTRRLSFNFSTFELLTRSWKITFLLRVTNSIVKLLSFHIRVNNSNSENIKLYYELLTQYRLILEV